MKASYTADVTGKRYRDEETVLDFGVYRPLIWINKKGVHEAHGQLEKIAKELTKWSASGSGIRVTTAQEQRKLFDAHWTRVNARKTRFPLRVFYRVKLRLLS